MWEDDSIGRGLNRENIILKSAFVTTLGLISERIRVSNGQSLPEGKISNPALKVLREHNGMEKLRRLDACALALVQCLWPAAYLP